MPYISFGKGMVNGASLTQIINTARSTKVSHVVDTIFPRGTEISPQTHHYSSRQSKLHPTRKWSRIKQQENKAHEHHICFIADDVECNHDIIQYCPTDEMIGDFFTKPLG